MTNQQNAASIEEITIATTDERPLVNDSDNNNNNKRKEDRRSEKLLNPNLIPESVRRNLLGLHQKSMLNLCNKSMLGLNEDTTSSVYLSHPVKNNLLKKYSRNQASLYDLKKMSTLKA